MIFSKLIKKNHQILNDPRGFTLAELAVGLGALVIVMAGMMTLQSTLSNSNKHAQLRNNQDALVQRMKPLLAYSDLCKKAIGADSVALGGTPLALTNADDTNANLIPDWREARGKEFVIAANNLQAGAAGIGTVAGMGEVFPALNLEIASLKVADLNPAAPSAGGVTRYVGKVFLQVKSIGGGEVPFRPTLVSGVRFDVRDATGAIENCSGGPALTSAEACVALGCTYNAAAVPPTEPCQCPRYKTGCAKPGEYPVAVENGQYVCEPLGDPNSNCPVGEYLVGFRLGQNLCAPMPTGTAVTCTPPFILGGLGAPSGTPGCACPGAGQVYNGSACVDVSGACTYDWVAYDTGYAESVCSSSGDPSGPPPAIPCNSVNVGEEQGRAVVCGSGHVDIYYWKCEAVCP